MSPLASRWLAARAVLGAHFFGGLARRALGLRRPGLDGFIGNYRPDGILPVPPAVRPSLVGAFQHCVACDLCVPACGVLGGPESFPGPRDLVVAHTRPLPELRYSAEVFGLCDFCGLCEQACPHGVPIRAMVAFGAQTANLLISGDRPLPPPTARAAASKLDAHRPVAVGQGRGTGTGPLLLLGPCAGSPAADLDRLAAFLAACGVRVERVDRPADCGARAYAAGEPWEQAAADLAASIARTGCRDVLVVSPCCSHALSDPVMRWASRGHELSRHSIWEFLSEWPGLRPGSWKGDAILADCSQPGETPYLRAVARTSGAEVIQGLCCGGWTAFRDRHEAASRSQARRVLAAASALGLKRILTCDPTCRANLLRERREADPAVADVLDAIESL